MNGLLGTNGHSTFTEYPPHSAQAAPTAESSASPRRKVASQIRAFQALADESDLDWDQDSWDELLQVMSIDEIFHGTVTDENGDIVISVDVLLEDIANLYQVEPEEQVWTQLEIKHMLGVLKQRGRGHFLRQYTILQYTEIPKLLLAFNINLCPELRALGNKTLMYFLNLAIGRALATRDKLTQFNTVQDAVELIRNAREIVILTGAGISVSCGIPDFRSRDGLYASLSEYQLDDPQQMFDITYFREKPSVFYSFASKIYPSNFVPSPCHRFIKACEDRGVLRRNYTQNIDTLEKLCGIRNVIQCHGSFATASCIVCRKQVNGSAIEAEILSQRVPVCTTCHPSNASPKKKKKKASKKKAKGQWDSDVSDESDGPDFPTGIMKPDITFFGEKLNDAFDVSLDLDSSRVDLLLIIGTSLKVSPVADMISHIPHSIPQILINKTPIRHINPDIVLLGNADTIINHLVEQLSWELPPPFPDVPLNTNMHRIATKLTERMKSQGKTPPVGLAQEPTRVGDSHVWLFEGAEGGKWLKDLQSEMSPRGKRATSSAEDVERNSKKQRV